MFYYTGKDKGRVESFVVNSQIEVISNGVDTDLFVPDGKQSNLIEHGGPIVLFVGRLVEGKRPMDAIRAVSRLSKKKKTYTYTSHIQHP